MFVNDNHYPVLYYNVSGMQSFVYRVKASSQAVVIEQSFMNVMNGGMDLVDFEICLTNDEFSRHDQYNELSKIYIYKEFELQYKTVELNNRNTTFANFEYENHEYYMSISSTKGQADLEYYMQLLLGKN